MTSHPFWEVKYNMEKKLIINVGRQFGSHGRDIAKALGRILDIPVYDNELLTKAAQESGFSESLFTKRDEKRRFWKIGNIFGGESNPGLNDGEIFKLQCDAIRKIASEGSAIFIGRASNYALRDLDCCLNVFICAPMSVRKEFISAMRNISLEEAEELIFKSDRRRAEFYNFFTDGHWGKSSDYDICVDSSKLGVEKTAEFIIEYGRKAGLID